MTKILITGANGFCARHLVGRLRKKNGIYIAGIDLNKKAPVNISLDDYMRVDICNQKQMTDLVRRLKPDFVFNLAGLNSGLIEDIFKVNILGTVNLLEAVKVQAPQARVLLIGSAAEYGRAEKHSLPVKEDHPCRPVGAYGISKHAMTLAGINYVQQFGMKVVVARPFNIIGPGISPGLLVGALVSRAKKALMRSSEPIVKIGNLNTERDFIYIDDAIDAYINMLEGEYWGEVFNICSGRHYSVLTVATLLLSCSARKINLEPDPSLVRPSDIGISYGDWSKADRAFNFKPVTGIEDSLKAVWRYEMEGF